MRSLGATRCLTGPIIKDLYLLGLRAAQDWRCDAQQYWVVCARASHWRSFFHIFVLTKVAKPTPEKQTKQKGLKTRMSRCMTLKMTSECSVPATNNKVGGEEPVTERRHASTAEICSNKSTRRRKAHKDQRGPACVSLCVQGWKVWRCLLDSVQTESKRKKKHVSKLCKEKKKPPQVSSGCTH